MRGSLQRFTVLSAWDVDGRLSRLMQKVIAESGTDLLAFSGDIGVSKAINLNKRTRGFERHGRSCFASDFKDMDVARLRLVLVATNAVAHHAAFNFQIMI